MTATGADEDGQSYSASVQSKGYLNSEYKVRTQYQVTLWRWEVMVQGSAGHMSWDMVLNSGDREDQNAYHEFFLVMQTELGQPFEISGLEFGGQVFRKRRQREHRRVRRNGVDHAIVVCAQTDAVPDR